jgi:hypothetical protein
MSAACVVEGCVRPPTTHCSLCSRPCCGRHSAAVNDRQASGRTICNVCIAEVDEAREANPRRAGRFVWKVIGACALGGFVVGTLLTREIGLGIVAAGLAAMAGAVLAGRHP